MFTVNKLHEIPNMQNIFLIYICRKRYNYVINCPFNAKYREIYQSISLHYTIKPYTKYSNYEIF